MTTEHGKPWASDGRQQFRTIAGCHDCPELPKAEGRTVIAFKAFGDCRLDFFLGDAIASMMSSAISKSV